MAGLFRRMVLALALGVVALAAVGQSATEVRAETEREAFERIMENRRNPKQCPDGFFFHLLKGTCETKVRAGCAVGCWRDWGGSCKCECPPGCYYNHASKDCRKRMGSSMRKC